MLKIPALPQRIRRLGRADLVEVSVYLRPRTALPRHAALDGPSLRRLPRLSHAELGERHGAELSDVAAVRRFAARHRLRIIDVHAGRRRVCLAGSARAMERAFDTELHQARLGERCFRVRARPHRLPPELTGIVTGVFGLDERPVARPYVRVAASAQALEAKPGFSPLEIAEMYNFPNQYAGSGQCIALLELDGAYSSDDLTSYFEGLALKPSPKVQSVAVNGVAMSPSVNDLEVMLDIEIAAALAPAATIVTYFTANSYRGFLDGVTAIIHDTTYLPKVLSLSWGLPEDVWAPGQTGTDGEDMRKEMEAAFMAAASLGITVFAAAGDHGSSDQVADGLPHVDFPAASPHVTACGGTRLSVRDGNIVEMVWNRAPKDGATGGGVSTVFPLPDYQRGVGVPSWGQAGATGRGVPDLAAVADPSTGIRVRCRGVDQVIGGTSAVAPMMAGLIARVNEALGRSVGFLNPQIYPPEVAKLCFRDVVSGDNGLYAAKAGWDACTGLGRVDGTALLAALRAESR